jgi:hypothetical protein
VDFKVGARWKSAVDDTQVITVRAPSGDVEVTCGGHPLIPMEAEAEPGLALQPGHDGGTLLGKRYADDESGIELLCTKGGAGALFLNGEPLGLKEAKPLPSSD